jgi:chloride channel protein, CIC family
MLTPGESLSAHTTIRDAIDRIRASSVQSCLVTDSTRVLGVVNLERLQRELTKGDSKTVGELVHDTNFPHVHADQSLDLALERMGTNHIQILPVVSRANIHELLGVVTLGDVLDSYGLGLPNSG